MRRRERGRRITLGLLAALVSMLGLSSMGSAEDPGSAAAAAETSESTDAPGTADATAGVDHSALKFTIDVGSRLYPDWKESHDVALYIPFFLGDTEFRASASRFVPDFKIADGKVISETQEWLNPALEVVVFQDTTAVDTVWAFKNFPPHYSARSFFTFQLRSIEGEPETKTSVPD